MLKRFLNAGLMATAVVALLAGIGSTVAYPTKPITLVVPFPPGGSTDIVGRVIADGLAKELKQPVVVENRGGAGGTVGTAAVAKAAPDGYTLSVGTTSTHAVGPATLPKVAYDPIKGFAPISLVAETPYVLVVNDKVAAKSVKELIALVKKQPGKFNYGSAGAGSTTHLAGAMFASMAGLKMEHIAYKGNGPATKAVLSGEVQVLMGSMPAVLSQIKSGSIRALAVGTVRRSPELPNVPTMQQAGLAGYEAALWLGIVAPAGTPDAIVKQLNAAVIKVVKSPEIAARLRKSGAEPVSTSPQEMGKQIREDLDKYIKLAKDIGIGKKK
ncbi:MAG: Bug family tripartite tricarboxylate transporter substrate binding protein [Xanthobacteraceae bacterium]